MKMTTDKTSNGQRIVTENGTERGIYSRMACMNTACIVVFLVYAYIFQYS